MSKLNERLRLESHETAEAYQAAVKEFSDELDQMTADLASREAQISELQKSMNEIKRITCEPRIAFVASEALAAKAPDEYLKARLGDPVGRVVFDLQAEIDRLNTGWQGTNHELRQLSEELAAVTKQRDEAREYHEAYREEMADGCAEMATKIAGAKTELRQLSEELAAVTKQRDDLQADNARLSGDLGRSMNEIATLSHDWETAESAVLYLNDRVAAISNQRDEAQQRLSQVANQLTIQTDLVAELIKQRDDLLFSVQRKFPGESRHETALRYIRDAESLLGPSACQSENLRDLIQ